jgi:hypothetical protein
MKKIKVKTGDVFLIPIDDTRWVIGQLVDSRNGELYVAIFPAAYHRQNIDPRMILDQHPLFLALTLDALIYHGNWPVIGNIKENLYKFPEPAFKVGGDDTMLLISRNQKIERRATKRELEVLKYRSMVTPMVLQNAVQAHFGLEEWNAHYDEFLPDYYYTTSKFIS